MCPYWGKRKVVLGGLKPPKHSRVRVGTKLEAERIGKYMVRPILALDRLLFLEREGKVGYRHGQNGVELETMDYLEFIARVTSHIPDKGQVMVRYYGLYANAHLCLRAGGPDGRRLAVLMETYYRLHECGRGERGLRIEGDAKGGRGTVQVRAGFRPS